MTIIRKQSPGCEYIVAPVEQICSQANSVSASVLLILHTTHVSEWLLVTPLTPTSSNKGKWISPVQVKICSPCWNLTVFLNNVAHCVNFATGAYVSGWSSATAHTSTSSKERRNGFSRCQGKSVTPRVIQSGSRLVKRDYNIYGFHCEDMTQRSPHKPRGFGDALILTIYPLSKSVWSLYSLISPPSKSSPMKSDGCLAIYYIPDLDKGSCSEIITFVLLL